jgi:GxxExxY protein
MRCITNLQITVSQSNRRKRLRFFYKEVEVGEYFADIIVNDLFILELKAQDYMVEENEFQLINYLKATHCEVGLLLNFVKKPEVIRKVYKIIENKIRFNLFSIRIIRVQK